MTADTTLAPCPFCGHVPLRKLGDSDNLVMLVCPPESACAASGMYTGYLLDDEAQAIAAWNRRAPLTDTQCDAIAHALDRWGRDRDIHDYGLPVYDDEAAKEWRDVIRNAAQGVPDDH